MEETKFDDIRPYRDNEFSEVKEKLIKNPLLKRMIQQLFPEIPFDVFADKIRESNTIASFQKNLSYPVLVKVINNTCSNFTYSGVENLNKSAPHLYITNHRDIVFDQLLFSGSLYENNFDTAEIAIGDNLITEEWIKDLLRINKSFIVKRGLPSRELVLESKKLSEYIYHTLVNRNHSVWIAQRAGRAKDNNDRTQQGVLNMIGMAAHKDLLEHFKKLNIVPVSLSYEHDPCDIEKVKTIYAERTWGKYIKQEGEDIESMKKGLMGYKGHVHIHYSKPLNDEIKDIPNNIHKNQLYNTIRSIVDRKIIEGYQLWKCNYIAFDIHSKSEQYKEYYTTEDRDKFIDDIEKKVDVMKGDKDILRSIFIEINARPLINLIEVKNNPVDYQFNKNPTVIK